MNINAGDIFLEIIGTPQLSTLESLPGVRCASLYNQARLGDATLHLSLEADWDASKMRSQLEANGVQVLGWKQAKTARAA
ncbi:MAG: hypothetical protein HC933_00965 [Pleurocapsa sp. SU_196_0]|nr:hypothetical protein [Pleurocapsa sp. SU_196_0]